MLMNLLESERKQRLATPVPRQGGKPFESIRQFCNATQPHILRSSKPTRLVRSQLGPQTSYKSSDLVCNMQFYQTRIEGKPLIMSSLLAKKRKCIGISPNNMEEKLLAWAGQGERVAGMVCESYYLPPLPVTRPAGLANKNQKRQEGIIYS